MRKPGQSQSKQAPEDVANGERRAAPGAGDLRSAVSRPIPRLSDDDARAREMRLDGHLGGERIRPLLEPKGLEQVRADRPEGSVVAQVQTEDHPQDEGETVVAKPLVRRHAAGRGASHRPPPRSDDEVGGARQDRPDEEPDLRRVVGPVGLHEHDGAGARGRSRAGAPQARVAVPTSRLVQHGPPRGADQRRAAVGRAVVDEERALEQAEAPELHEERGQGLGLIEHGHDDEVRFD